jgi:hypothetical protein
MQQLKGQEAASLMHEAAQREEVRGEVLQGLSSMDVAANST